MQTLFGNAAQQSAPVNPSVSEPIKRQVPASRARHEVAVVDFQMPFGSMVIFLFKWALASVVVGIVFAVAILTLMIFLSVLGGISMPAVTK